MVGLIGSGFFLVLLIAFVMIFLFGFRGIVQILRHWPFLCIHTTVSS